MSNKGNGRQVFHTSNRISAPSYVTGPVKQALEKFPTLLSKNMESIKGAVAQFVKKAHKDDREFDFARASENCFRYLIDQECGERFKMILTNNPDIWKSLKRCEAVLRPIMSRELIKYVRSNYINDQIVGIIEFVLGRADKLDLDAMLNICKQKLDLKENMENLGLVVQESLVKYYQKKSEEQPIDPIQCEPTNTSIETALDQWRRLQQMNPWLEEKDQEGDKYGGDQRRQDYLEAKPPQTDDWWVLELRMVGYSVDTILRMQAYYPFIHPGLSPVSVRNGQPVAVIMLRCPVPTSIPASPIISYLNKDAPTLKTLDKYQKQLGLGISIALEFNMGFCSNEFSSFELPKVGKSRFREWRGRQSIQFVKSYLNDMGVTDDNIRLFDAGGADFESVGAILAREAGIPYFAVGHPAGIRSGSKYTFAKRLPPAVKESRANGAIQFLGTQPAVSQDVGVSSDHESSNQQIPSRVIYY